MAIKIPVKHTVENGTGPSGAPDRGVNGTRRDDVIAEADNETENENEDNENNENDEEEEEDDDDDEGPYTPFDPPCKRSLIWPWEGRDLGILGKTVFTWLPFYYSIPKETLDERQCICRKCLQRPGLCCETFKDAGTWATVGAKAFCGWTSPLRLLLTLQDTLF